MFLRVQIERLSPPSLAIFVRWFSVLLSFELTILNHLLAGFCVVEQNRPRGTCKAGELRWLHGPCGDRRSPRAGPPGSGSPQSLRVVP